MASSGGDLFGEWRWLSAEETKRKELGCEDIRKYMGGLRKKRKIEEMEMGNNAYCRDDGGENNKRLSRRLSPLLSIRPTATVIERK